MKPRTSTLSTVDCLLLNNSDVIQTVSSIRRSYETELEKVIKVFFLKKKIHTDDISLMKWYESLSGSVC